jgi:hypothetical protein
MMMMMATGANSVKMAGTVPASRLSRQPDDEK